jgi:RimJ/RimL family protein N-acetyltransferase
MSVAKARTVPVLETPRLRMRPLTLEDTPAIFAIHSDLQTLQYWSHDPFLHMEQAAELIRGNLEWVETGQAVYWAVEDPSVGELIGTATLFKFDDQNRHAEVGYILHRDFWGKGLMSEVLATMIDHAFNTLELHRLEADTDPRNAPSNALLEKFGFRREGYFRERWWVHGQWLDSLMFGLLRSEYQAAPPPGVTNG